MDWYEQDIDIIEEAVRNASPNYDADFEYLYKILKKRYKKVNEKLSQLESKMDRIEELLVSIQTNTCSLNNQPSVEPVDSILVAPTTCTIRLGDG